MTKKKTDKIILSPRFAQPEIEEDYRRAEELADNVLSTIDQKDIPIYVVKVAARADVKAWRMKKKIEELQELIDRVYTEMDARVRDLEFQLNAARQNGLLPPRERLVISKDSKMKQINIKRKK